MKCTAILPIKAESTRLPGKNFKMLGGKPLWRWMYDCLQECDFIEHIIINTDCPERFWDLEDGTTTVERRAEGLCDPDTNMNLIIADIVTRWHTVENFVQVHATTPFMSIVVLAV